VFLPLFFPLIFILKKIIRIFLVLLILFNFHFEKDHRNIFSSFDFILILNKFKLKKKVCVCLIL